LIRLNILLLVSVLLLMTDQAIGEEKKEKEVVAVPTIPSWHTAKRTMLKCYDGWNVTVDLKSGIEYRQDLNEYEDENVYSSLEDQRDTDDTETTSSYTTSLEQYDAEYSRDRQRTSGFAGVVMTVPLYSRKLRLERKEDTNKQIEHIADLYANFDGHKATFHALLEEKKVLKRVMIDDGQKGISAYYSLLQNIEQERALMNSSGRKILVILENCGYVASNEIARAR
jgi:hypothetical protein